MPDTTTPNSQGKHQMLHQVLAKLYLETESARRLLKDAGIPTDAIVFGPNAIKNWFNVLQEAGKHNAIEVLVGIASEEYCEDVALAVARRSFFGKVEPPTARHVRPHVEDADPLPQGAEVRQRYALLIGVRDYVDNNFSDLPYTVHDVMELERVLNASGYDAVVALHDEQVEERLLPTRSNIWGELQNLIDASGPGDLLLVHFGGHGDLHNGNAYLLSRDTRRSDYANTALNLDTFNQRLASASAQARILLLDACHSGIGRSTEGMDPDFERHVYLEAAGTATLASCLRNERAYEYDKSPHGAFTHFLLEGLRGGAANGRFITFQNLSNYVTRGVKQWALDRGYVQTPNAHSKLVGDPPLIKLETQALTTKTAIAPNPFSATLAVRQPECFVGRTAELRRLEAMLQQSSVTLLGEPKIGKSSLLWRLADHWPHPVIGPLDCHNVLDRNDFYEQLAELLNLADSQLRTLRTALRSGPRLILLDELGAAPDWGLSDRDLKFLRAQCGQNTDLRIVTASRIPLRELFVDSGRDSPAYNFLSPLTLGPLTTGESRQLLSHPWAANAHKFDVAAVEEILDLCKHHPFRLQRAAFHRYEALYDETYNWRSTYIQDMEHLL